MRKAPAYPTKDNPFVKILEAATHAGWWAELSFHPSRRWRFDYACPDYGIAIEIDGAIFQGGRHSGGVGQLKDMEKMNAAAEQGWLVLHYTPDMSQGFIIDQVLRTIENRRDETCMGSGR